MKTFNCIFLGGALVAYAAAQTAIAPAGFEAWLMPIEKRVFAGTFTRNPGNKMITLTGLKNEYLSAQIACRNDRAATLSYSKTALKGPGGEIPAEAVRVRYGAYLPVDETEVYTADPLMESPTYDLPANIVQPVWVTIHVPKSARAGKYTGSITLVAGGRSVVAPVEVNVLAAALPDPPDYKFYLNIWQDPNGVARAHGVKLWSEEHWQLLSKYAENLAQHGEKSIMTSIMFDPWSAQTGYVFPTMVEWNYPGEWKQGSAKNFTWDFSIFDRYVETMMKAGVRGKIDMYAMVKGPGATPDASIRYFDTQAKTYRNQELKAGDTMWREAWTAFLPVLKKHLEEKGWWKIAYLGFDEKPKQIIDALFSFLGEFGQDYKLVMSGGHGRAGGNSEVVIYWDDLISPDYKQKTEPLIKSLRDNNQLVTFYTACEPRFPNTFLYSSLRESRMLGWVAIKYNVLGYTRWAVNAFPADVWKEPNFKWHSGDMYFVYPGPDGPLDGMRWELMRQGIEDYEAYRIAMEMATQAGRNDLVKLLGSAVEKANILDSCGDIPPAGDAREVVNAVLRELAKSE